MQARPHVGAPSVVTLLVKERAVVLVQCPRRCSVGTAVGGDVTVRSAERLRVRQKEGRMWQWKGLDGGEQVVGNRW